MPEVRVAIIGMGIGRDNGRAIDRHPRATVAALCDLETDRMESFAKELGHEIAYFTDYKKLCAWDGIDAVFVGSPNQMHVPMALEAVKRGKHVMITKPLSDSAAAARKLVEAQEAAGVVGMMSLSTRFGANCLHMKQHIDAGEFGDIYYARARSIRRSGIPAWNLGFISAGGGAFRDMGVHALDAVWWLMGMPQPVSVTGVSGAKFGPRGQGYWDFQTVPESTWSKYDTDDYAGGFIRFADGSGLQIESFWASHMPPEFQIELFGTEAGARVYPPTIYRTVHGAPEDSSIALPRGPEAWDNIAGHFIEAIADGVPCSAPLRHGLIIQEMLEAMLKSAETGKETKLGKGA